MLFSRPSISQVTLLKTPTLPKQWLDCIFFNANLILNRLSVFYKKRYCSGPWVNLPQITTKAFNHKQWAVKWKIFSLLLSSWLFWATWLFSSSASTQTPSLSSVTFLLPLPVPCPTSALCTSPAFPADPEQQACCFNAQQFGGRLKERVEVEWT